MRGSLTMTSASSTATSSDQWMQFYYQQQQQPLMDHALAPNTEPFSDGTAMTISPTSTMPPTSGQLTPKGSVSKPIRRRSRASKRTPTTLLNANTTNFRALVQQFTGCPNTTMSTLGIHKGPITLNFQQGSGNKAHKTTSRTMVPFSSTSYTNNNTHNQVPQHQVSQPLPWQKQQEQQLPLQEQQSGYSSLDYVKSSDFVPTSGNSIRPSTSMDVSDGLTVDHDFSLHDLTMNAFPNDGF